MSYTSKYTGQEIDNLLDKVGTLGVGQVILLAESDEAINFSAGQNGQNINKDYTLKDNIENYDIIAVEWGTTAADSLVPYFCLTEAIKKDNYETKYIALGGVSISERLTEVHFKFTSTETLNVVYARSMNYDTIIIKKIYGIKLNGANGTASANNPIGAIVPIMGTQAPKDHLICDGSELNINEYKELADYFETQFGSKNYFGGDGIMTFAVPDLRNEFLRGYGDKSNEVGIHQDATSFLNIRTWNGGLYADYENNTTICPENMDTTFFSTGKKQCGVNKADMITNTNGQEHAKFTSRPTNVAVLFCIKYTESGSTNGRSGYKEVELLSAPIECSIAINNVHTQINKTVVLNDFTSNYDEISIGYDFYQDGTGYIHNEEKRFQVSNIVYNNSDTQSFNGSRRSFMHTILDAFYNLTYWFKDEKTMRLGATASSQTTNAYSKYRIYSIKGIKY